MASCLHASCPARALSSPTATRRRAQATARRPATQGRAAARPVAAAAAKGASASPSPGRWTLPLPPGAGTDAQPEEPPPASTEVTLAQAAQVAAALAAACGIPPEEATGLAPQLAARGPDFLDAVQQHSGTVVDFLQAQDVPQPEVAALALRRPKLFSVPPDRHLTLLVEMGLSAEEAARFMVRQRSQMLSDGFHVDTAVTPEERRARIAALRRLGLNPRQLLTAFLTSDQTLLDRHSDLFEGCYEVLSAVLGMGSKGARAVLKRCPPLRSDVEVSVENVCARAQALAQRYGREAALKMVEVRPFLLTEQLSSQLPPALQRWEAVLSQCGVQQPAGVLSSFAGRMNYDALDPRALGNRLAVERCMRLSAAQVYAQFGGLLRPLSSAYPAARLAGRLALLEQRGLLPLLVADKWAAHAQWLAEQGLPADASFQVGEPDFIGLADVASKSDNAFFELPALRGTGGGEAGGAGTAEGGAAPLATATDGGAAAPAAEASAPADSAAGASAPAGTPSTEASTPTDSPNSSPLREAWSAYLAAGREEAVRLRCGLPDELRPALEPFWVRLNVRDSRYQ